MSEKISKRLLEIIDALPLRKGMRVLEIGCGPGAAAREVAKRLDGGYVFAIDRSAKAIAQAIRNSSTEMENGILTFHHCKVEEFVLPKDQKLFDIAFAIRVGALDGRHPEIEALALERISKALKKGGKLFIDHGNTLKEKPLR